MCIEFRQHEKGPETMTSDLFDVSGLFHIPFKVYSRSPKSTEGASVEELR